jgi:hypothetical protein
VGTGAHGVYRRSPVPTDGHGRTPGGQKRREKTKPPASDVEHKSHRQRGEEPLTGAPSGCSPHVEEASRCFRLVANPAEPLTFLKAEPSLTGEKVSALYTWCQITIPRVPRFSWVTENLSGGVADTPGPSAQFLERQVVGSSPGGRPSFFVLVSVIRRDKCLKVATLGE